jgi:hypothetical protein
MTFLPPNYKAPEKTGGNYMKLQDGVNKFRVLSEAITGYEYWNTDNKSVRSPLYPASISDIRPGDKVKHFWAFVVWNYAESAVQILEITQASIRDELIALQQNVDWGEPFGYDITITKTGQKMETKYSVQPSPHKPAPAEALAKYETMAIDLPKLYSGDNPFIGQAEDASERPANIDPRAFRPDVVAQHEGEFPDDGSDVVPFP